MDTTDLYKVLGVAKGASDKEIKRAYRQKARQYHPDLNDNDESAEKKFAQINRAYEVLSDQKTRQKYDQFGPNFEQMGDFGGSYQQGGAHGGFDFRQGGFGGGGQFDSFFDLFGGGGFGSGGGRASQGQDIEQKVRVTLKEAYSGVTKTLRIQSAIACKACGGVGVSSQGVCSRCQGQGQVLDHRTLELKIPKGVTDGSRIKFKGRGGASRRGGVAGDLYVIVELSEVGDFEVKGHHLTIKKELSAFDAMLGTKILIETPKGKIDLKIPAGSQGGQSMRLRGLGIPKSKGPAGDIYVQLELKVPAQLDAEQESLVRQLKESFENC